MLIEEENVRAGMWLFRWRSYFPLLLLVFVIFAVKEFTYPLGSRSLALGWELFCLSLSIFGLFIRAYTIGHTPKGTSGRNKRQQVAHSLNTTGIYSTTRNPLYFGNFFMVLGVIVFFRHWWLCVFYVMAFWLFIERIIAAEEAYLKKTFGDEYLEYARRTPIFFPDFVLWRRSELRFSLRNVLKREHPSLFGVITILTFVNFLGDYIVMDRLVFDPVWTGIFTVTLIIYLTLRLLDKYTRILRVEGR